MAIKVDLKFTKADGSDPITFNAWVETLPEERQKEFEEARIREEALNISMTENKKIHTDRNIEHWDSEESFLAHKFDETSHDLVWKDYWDEYLSVNEIIFEHVVSNLE
jgi:hypothetical protein